MKYLIAAIALLSSHAFATVTVRFSNPSNALTGLSDTSTTVADNGLSWGILIDAEGNGFDLGAKVGLSLTDGADFGAKDYFYFGGSTTTIPGGGGGNGGVSILSAADVYSSDGVTINDQFAVIWFQSGLVEDSPFSAGDRYGLVENAGLLIPADGAATTDYTALFAGPDPIRPANIELVPEPSTALLAFLGMAGLIRRRR